MQCDMFQNEADHFSLNLFLSCMFFVLLVAHVSVYMNVHESVFVYL